MFIFCWCDVGRVYQAHVEVRDVQTFHFCENKKCFSVAASNPTPAKARWKLLEAWAHGTSGTGGCFKMFQLPGWWDFTWGEDIWSRKPDIAGGLRGLISAGPAPDLRTQTSGILMNGKLQWKIHWISRNWKVLPSGNLTSSTIEHDHSNSQLSH